MFSTCHCPQGFASPAKSTASSKLGTTGRAAKTTDAAAVAMEALRELADLMENQTAIRECGGIPPLVAVLSSGSSSEEEVR